VILFTLLWLLPQLASAQRNEFSVPPSLQGQVDFWIQVFTKYGKNQMVFHHRDDPAIIYSTLDFTELTQNYSGSKFARLKEEMVDREIERIQSQLHKLASGLPLENATERRLDKLFERFGGNKRARFLEATQIEKIRSQTGVKERFREGLRRSGQYLSAIEDIFSERGLPPELGRLPFVESSFDYDAYSSVGAAGIWQFMRGTAKSYMRVSAAIDERRDPIVSTRAAAQYLSRAYKVLGAWPLAMTSYNHGITGVLRASRSVGSTDLARIIKEYEGKGWGFASKNFYTEFLAALEVERNYRRYFPDLVLDNPVYFDEVRIGSAVPYSELVAASGMSGDSFEHLNPALRRKFFGLRTAVPAGILVKVPYGKGPRILAVSRASMVTWQHSPSGSTGVANLGEPKPKARIKAKSLRAPALSHSKAVKKVKKGKAIFKKLKKKKQG